jgi:ABC-type bacteriocin/lantibiotic exporter with double-glycine peptidase domain
MYRNKTINRIWKENKRPILYIYGLNIIEEIMYLLIPSSVGLLIDTFIQNKGYGVYAFIITYLGWQGIGVYRRIADTKTFTKIFNTECLRLVEKHQVREIDTTIINARVELMKQVVDFFERDFPFMVNSIISIIGAAILLYFYNPKLLWISFLVIIPSIIFNYFYSKQIEKVTADVNDQYENQVTIIESKNFPLQKKYFEKLRRFTIKKSSLEAYNFGLIEVFVFLMILSSLYVICHTEKMNYGSIVASYGIILRFAYGFDFIPHTTTKLASLKDVIKRIDEYN